MGISDYDIELLRRLNGIKQFIDASEVNAQKLG